MKPRRIVVANVGRKNTEESLDVLKRDKENENKGVPIGLNYNNQMKRRIEENLTRDQDVPKDDDDISTSDDGLKEMPFFNSAASPEKYLHLANPNMKLPHVNLKPNMPPTMKKVKIVVRDNSKKTVKFVSNEAVKVDSEAVNDASASPCVRKCNAECIEYSDARELSVFGNAEFLRYHASQHKILNSYKMANEELLVAIMEHYQSDHHPRHFVIPTLDEAKSVALDAITAPKKYRIAIRYGPYCCFFVFSVFG